jgi:hypothetical protein
MNSAWETSVAILNARAGELFAPIGVAGSGDANSPDTESVTLQDVVVSCKQLTSAAENGTESRAAAAVLRELSRPPRV